MPDVFDALVVNWLPVVGGELDDVNDVIASPSGSLALTGMDPGTLGAKVADAGAVTTGARLQPLQTKIVVRAVPERTLLAVNVTV